IGAGLYLNGLTPAKGEHTGIVGDLNLRSAQTRLLRDDGSAWPEHGHIILDGFTYEHFDSCPTGADFRRRWLLRQPPSHLSGQGFRAQPWQQVFLVLKRMGHAQDSVRIQIWKFDRMVASGAFGWWGGLWNRLLGLTCGYGHRPWSAVQVCLAF